MNARYLPSPLARALAGASLAASIIGSADPAAAVSCTFPFPTAPTGCVSGSSNANVAHEFNVAAGQFSIGVNWRGGSQGAVAYGIDVNGNHLNKCATTVADDDVSVGTSSVSCQNLYGVAGTAPPSRFYNHAFNMRSTFLLVI